MIYVVFYCKRLINTNSNALNAEATDYIYVFDHDHFTSEIFILLPAWSQSSSTFQNEIP